MKHTKLLTAVTASSLGLLLAGAPGALAAPSAAPSAATVAPAALPAATSLPVGGTLNGAPFNGAISNLRVTSVKGVPTLTGALNGAGIPAGTTFSAPITGLTTGGSCTILTLDLGPLHLNVLGLVVDLNAIHLNITAQQGAGNLLGNLLCAIAGLLDNNGQLNGIIGLLNRLLTGLGL